MNVELKQLGCVVESYKRCPPSLPSLFPLLIIIYLSISRHSHTPLPSLSPHLSHLPSWAFSSICKCLSAKWNHARGEVDEGSKKRLYHLFSSAPFSVLYVLIFNQIALYNVKTSLLLLIQQRVNTPIWRSDPVAQFWFLPHRCLPVEVSWAHPPRWEPEANPEHAGKEEVWYSMFNLLPAR